MHDHDPNIINLTSEVKLTEYRIKFSKFNKIPKG